MLVRCPKCNFSQPQDQYCAQCGIDMLSFKPIDLPFHKKLLKSGLFQFFFVLVLGAVIAYLVVNTNQPQQWVQRINRFKTLSVPNSSPTKTAIVNESTDNTQNLAAAAPTEVMIESASQQQVDQFANTNIDRSRAIQPTTTTTAAASKTKVLKVKIMMIEIDREFLNNLFQLAQNQNMLLVDSAVKAASIPDLLKKINIPYVTLKNINNQIDIDKIFTLWSGSSRSTEQDTLGLQIDIKTLQVDINPQSETSDVVTTAIKISKSSYQNLTTAFELNYVLVKNSTLLISGRSLLSDFEFKNQLHNTPPFNVYKSIDFKNEKTEFAILIEIQSQD